MAEKDIIERIFPNCTIVNNTEIIWNKRVWRITSDCITSKFIEMKYAFDARKSTFKFYLERYTPRDYMRILYNIVKNTGSTLTLSQKALKTTKLAIIFLIFNGAVDLPCRIVDADDTKAWRIIVNWHGYDWSVQLVHPQPSDDPFHIVGFIKLRDSDGLTINVDFHNMRLSFDLPDYYYWEGKRKPNEPRLPVLDDLFGGRHVHVTDVAKRLKNSLPLSLLTVLQGKGGYYYFAPIPHKIGLIMQLLRKTNLLMSKESLMNTTNRNTIRKHLRQVGKHLNTIKTMNISNENKGTLTTFASADLNPRPNENIETTMRNDVGTEIYRPNYPLRVKKANTFA